MISFDPQNAGTAFRLAIVSIRDQVGVDFGHFLGDEAVLHGLRTIGKRFAVAEGDGPRAQESAAGFTHVVNVGLESPRRTDRAELPVGVDSTAIALFSPVMTPRIPAAVV